MKRKQARALAVLSRNAVELNERLSALIPTAAPAVAVSKSAAVLLRTIQGHGPQTMPDLARRRGLSRQHVRSLVQELMGQGWIELHPNPTHRRSRLVNLSGAGRQVVEGWQQAEAGALRRLPCDVPRKRLERAALVLGELCRELEATRVAGLVEPSGGGDRPDRGRRRRDRSR